MLRKCSSGFPDDDLELYALGRLSAELTSSLEEHLLVCEECRIRMQATDDFIYTIRQALVPDVPILAALRRERTAVGK